MFAPAFGGLALLDLLASCLKLTDVQQFGIGVATMIFSFLMAYCRLILGVHALNQVIFGLLLGVWLAAFFHFMARDIIFEYVKNTCY
jgi:membrane-associated phospholipid phosphatase